MELGMLIQQKRRQAGLTIDELSERSGVPKGTLNKIINGVTRDPQLETVKALARALDAKKALNVQRTEDYRTGTCARAGGVVDPLPEDAPFYVKDYHDYYKTSRGYHARSLNSNGGWNVTGTMSFMNQPILRHSNEIRSAVLIIHGEKAHSCYFSRDAYAAMVEDDPNPENKELLIIPGAVHTDLYDKLDVIPFDKMVDFFQKAMQ